MASDINSVFNYLINMKLVYKNIIINTVVSVLILFAGEFSLYFFLKNKIEKETVEHLYLERYIMMKQLKKGVNIESFRHNIGDVLEIETISSVFYSKPIIQEIEVDEEWEEEHFTSKKIIFDVIQNGRTYRVSILKTIDEDEGLAGSMEAIIFISTFCMLIILVAINVLVYYKLFSPVYQLINDIKNFSVQNLKKIVPPKTTTQEFVILSQEVSKMSEKMIKDYSSVKEFIENMTHEIQTPLAVINTKVERCMQDENLTNDQAILLSDTSKAVNKLFNINKGLTLLSKLDNKQYNSPEEIQINKLIQQRIHYFLDFIENKKITLNENYFEECYVTMDISLAEILVDNLFKNAIQHNFEAGKIEVTVKKNEFVIRNTGEIPIESTDKFFNRFYSQNAYKSLGLGLAIVKKITDYYNFTLNYNFELGVHSVTINFK